MLLVEKRNAVALITLNRPKSLNALCNQLIHELGIVFQDVQKERDSIGCVVLTGSKKAFAGNKKLYFILNT